MPYRIRNHHSGGHSTSRQQPDGPINIRRDRIGTDGSGRTLHLFPQDLSNVRRPRHQIVNDVQRSQHARVLCLESRPIDLIDPQFGRVHQICD